MEQFFGEIIITRDTYYGNNKTYI